MNFPNPQQPQVPGVMAQENFYPQLMTYLRAQPGIAIPNVKPTISRRKFSREEDEKLRDLVSKLGETDWHGIAAQMDNRTARQCRERWKHYLNPDVSTGPWTEDEDKLLREKYAELGAQWSRIAKSFPNRTDITVKNRWISLKGRRQVGEERPEPPQEAPLTIPPSALQGEILTNAPEVVAELPQPQQPQDTPADAKAE